MNIQKYILKTGFMCRKVYDFALNEDERKFRQDISTAGLWKNLWTMLNTFLYIKIFSKFESKLKASCGKLRLVDKSAAACYGNGNDW